MSEYGGKMIAMLDRSLGATTKDVVLAAATGSGSSLVVAAYLKKRVLQGDRCLVLYPMANMGIANLKVAEPELAIGRLGSGAPVQVANYLEAERKFCGDASEADKFDFLVMDEGGSQDPARVAAVRAAFPRARVLMVVRQPMSTSVRTAELDLSVYADPASMFAKVRDRLAAVDDEDDAAPTMRP